MITVYGRATSVNVQLVMWCVGELGLPFERHDVGGAFGGNDTPEYLKMNPMGLVPVIKDGDTILWESHTILRYLLKKYGDHPSDPGQAAQIEKWADWVKSHLYTHMTYNIFWQLVRTPVSERNTAQIKESADFLDSMFRIISEELHGDYFGGDQLNMADYAFGVLLYRYFTLDFPKNPPQAIADYYDRLATRPSFQTHVMVDYGPLRVPGA